MTEAQRRVIATARKLLAAVLVGLVTWLARWWIRELSSVEDRKAERLRAMAPERGAGMGVSPSSVLDATHPPVMLRSLAEFERIYGPTALTRRQGR